MNCHYDRSLSKNIISLEKAKEKLNKNGEILSEGMAIIPTEFATELFCYEFKGKAFDNDFLIYINAETRKRRRYSYDC